MKKCDPMRRILILLIMVLFITGCNIFGFTNDAEKPPIDKAEEAIRNGNYTLARKELAESVKDSTDALALYLDAKAAILESGMDMATIIDFIDGQDEMTGDDLALLNIIDGLDYTEQTAWYRGNLDALANLSKLWNEEIVGVIPKDDLALDYTASNMMSGIFGLRDTDRNGVINDNDFIIDLSLIKDFGDAKKDGYNFDGGKFIDENGDTVEFEGLAVFLGALEERNGTAKISASIKGKKGYKLENINDLIAFILSILRNGLGGIRSLLGSLNSSFDAKDIEKYIDEIAAIINFYWYDDGLDNDGDGRIDEEWIDGKDNDGDGLIDEDSDYTDPAIVLAPGYDPSNYFPKENNTDNENTQYHGLFLEWKNR